MRGRYSRRETLQLAGIGAAGLTAVSNTGSSGNREDPTASVTFEDQTTSGRQIVVAAVDTSVDVRYSVVTDGHEQVFKRGELTAGTDSEELTIELDQLLTTDRRLKFTLYDAKSGNSVAQDWATVAVDDDAEALDGVPVTRIEPDSAAGFNYPYYLYAPPVLRSEAGDPMLVEPNNSGTPSDDLETHETSAESRIRNGFTRDIAGQLRVPLLIPVFPRPETDPVDWTHYVHQLDRETMAIDDGPLERVDRQLLSMVEHARERLSERDYPVDGEGILLNGFSASGNFVDRFTVLHPGEVVSVTAGGLNGMALLPLTESKGRTLNYHVGIADVESLTGEPVDLDALDEVNQFLYMGSEDTNDTIGYDDAWTSDELEATALEVYGEQMIAERFPFCQRAYDQAGVRAQFRVYEGVGHSPRAAAADIVEFHRRSITGESVSEFGQNVRSETTFEFDPSDVEADEEVTFDASESQAVPGAEIAGYTWDFGDGETAAGPQPSHRFTAAGDYTITLSVISDDGVTETATQRVSVAESDTSTGGSTGDGCNISGGDGEINIGDLGRAARIFATGGDC